jgi:uncharacterized membrane-anchored protein
MLTLAVYNAVLKITIAENGYWPVFYWTAILGQIMLLPTIPLFLTELRSSYRRERVAPRELIPLSARQLLSVANLALISLLANLAANKAFAANVSLSAAIVSLPLSMILAFLFSVFAPELLEKHSPKIYAIRFTAAAVMFWSALQLSA